jgi:ABC-type branched-subunit amino acid transport system permease subunit
MYTLFELSRPLIQLRPAFFGLSMVLVLLFMPGGLESLFSKFFGLWRSPKKPPATETE